MSSVPAPTPERPQRGQKFRAYSDHPEQRHLFITVTRVARDGTWADIRVQNCFVMWTKRQKLPLPACVPYAWTEADLERQCDNWTVPA